MKKRFCLLAVGSLVACFAASCSFCEGDDSSAGSGQADDDHDEPTTTVCPRPQEPPSGYFDSEAIWIVARFPDEDFPWLGLYAYFWIDRYQHEDCAYTSALAVLYPRDESASGPVAWGGVRKTWEIEYGPPRRYDIAVKPLLHFSVDPNDSDTLQLKITAPDFEGRIVLRLRHLHAWSERYFSFFDTTVEKATITIGGATHETKGFAVVEHWVGLGFLEPAKGEWDLVRGYWIYAPLSWEDDEGGRLDTLTWYWVEHGENGLITVLEGGALSRGSERWVITELEPDFSFPENLDSKGYLNRHALRGRTAGGPDFSYEVVSLWNYVDRYPESWEELYFPAVFRESHAFVEGTLDFDGVTYTGGGILEWHVTRDNPLPG